MGYVFQEFFPFNSWARVSNLQRLNHTQILVEYRPGTLACVYSVSSSTTPILPSRVLFHSPLPRPRHLDPPPALALLSTPSPLIFDLYQLIGLSGLCDPVDRAAFLLFPVPGCNMIRFEYHRRSPPRCHWKNLTRNKQISPPWENLFMGISKTVTDIGQCAQVIFLAPVSAPVLITEKKSPRKKFN